MNLVNAPAIDMAFGLAVAPRKSRETAIGRVVRIRERYDISRCTTSYDVTYKSFADGRQCTATFNVDEYGIVKWRPLVPHQPGP